MESGLIRRDDFWDQILGPELLQVRLQTFHLLLERITDALELPFHGQQGPRFDVVVGNQCYDEPVLVEVDHLKVLVLAGDSLAVPEFEFGHILAAADEIL